MKPRVSKVGDRWQCGVGTSSYPCSSWSDAMYVAARLVAAMRRGQ